MNTWDLILYGGAVVAAVALAYLATTRPARRRSSPPRHTRDLFGRPGATTTGGTFTGAVITCLDSDWPTDLELEDAEWECLWTSLDRLLAKEAHDGTMRLVAAGVPLDVIAEHSVAEVLRHERALAVADALTGEWPALVGAA